MKNRLIIRAGQYIVIALSFVCFCRIAQAQFVWQISDTTPSNHWYELRTLSCRDGSCIAWIHDQLLVAPFSSKWILTHSSDFGATWHTYDPEIPHIYRGNALIYMAIDQIDSENAYAVGDSGIALRTTNAGATWTKLTLPPVGWVLYDVSFSDPLHGMICSPSGTLTTSDGGVSWDSVLRLPSQISFPISCHSYGNGRFSEFLWYYGPVYTTTDSWHSYDSGSSLMHFGVDSMHHFAWRKCKWLGGDTLLAMGNEIYSDTIKQQTYYRGILCFSYDGGKTWDPPILDTILPSFDAISSYGNTIYGSSSVYRNVLRKSTDRGRTWTFDTLQFSGDTTRVFRDIIDIAYAGDGTLVGAFSEEGQYLIAHQIRTSLAVKHLSDLAQLNFFPNPATTSITISRAVGDRVELLDLLGRSVLRQELTNGTIDVSSLARGMYELLIYDHGTLVQSRKVAVVP